MARLVLILALVLPAAALAEGHTVYLVGDLYTPQPEVVHRPAEAAELVERARRAARDGRVSVALQLATEALQLDPDEPTCRRVLGYERVEGPAGGARWLSPFQAKQIKRGFVWDARFGWVKAKDLPRYEAGERPAGRRGSLWVSVEEDKTRHADIGHGWQVRTDHFAVTTNHSLEAAARLAVELEQLFQVWRQLFAGYYLGDAEVLARFEGKRRARARPKPFNVIYHRDKAGYAAALRSKQPRIDETIGIYFDDLREAHFYADNGAGAGQVRATLYHEAVHQLFQESSRAKWRVGREHNFWAVEGAPTYFESLTLTEGPHGSKRFVIGSPRAGRLPATRENYLRRRYLTPFDEMVSLGLDGFQHRPDLRPLYGQVGSVATFLMHAEGGRRREAFVRFLKRLYAGKAGEGALAQECGETLSDLQASYARWLERLPE